MDSITTEIKGKPKSKLQKKCNKGEINTYETFLDCCQQDVQGVPTITLEKSSSQSESHNLSITASYFRVLCI